MLCPVCKVDLLLSEKQGIEIDYCPKCRGIWLDRGEIEKIIERSQSAENDRKGTAYGKRREYDEDYYDDDRKKYDSNYPHRKRKGFLGDIFDF